MVVHNVTGEYFSGALSLAVCDKSGAVIHILPAVTCDIPAGSEENILFKPVLPDFLTVNDRALHVMMRSGNQDNIWDIISGENGNSLHAVKVVRKEKENDVFLKSSLPETIFYKEQINKYQVEVINQGREGVFTFVLAFVDRTTNITHVLSRVNDCSLNTSLKANVDFDATLPADIKAGDRYTLMVFCESQGDESEIVNTFNILPGVNDSVISTREVLIKADFKYNPDLEVITQPNFPEELSAREPVALTFTIRAVKKITPILIYITLIDLNGRETFISRESLVLGMDANELRDITLTTKIEKEFSAGSYFVGISCLDMKSKEISLLQPAENVKNPVDVTVLPVIQSPNIKLTQALPLSMTLHPHQQFRVQIYPLLTVQEYDNSAFYGQFSVYLIAGQGEKVLLGQKKAIALSHKHVGFVGIPCVVPAALSGNTGTIVIEAADDLYPEIGIVVKGLDESINYSTHVIVA